MKPKSNTPVHARKPDWLKQRLPSGPNFEKIRGMIQKDRLHTVCQEAGCPNIWECWNCGTATFMVLGDVCTRDCRFCGVAWAKKPREPDPEEPEKIAKALADLNLSWAVVTSVTRDDLADYGAAHFAACVEKIHEVQPETGVEILIPDFMGDPAALDTVIRSKPQVIAHNVETVPRLCPLVRPQADYRRSLNVLSCLAKEAGEAYLVKSSLVLGLGESIQEVRQVFRDLVSCGVSALTMGQYLAPSKKHFRVSKFYTPEEFRLLAQMARESGIGRVVSGPLVRSSYRAHELAGRQLHRA